MNQTQSPSIPYLKDLLEIFSDQIKLISGDFKGPISGLSQPKEAKSSELVVISDKSLLEEAKSGSSSIWVVHTKLISEDLKQLPIALISCDQPKVFMAQLAQRFFRPTDHHLLEGEARIHPSAVIDATASIGREVVIGPNAVIGKNVQIGDHSIIGAGAIVENHVKIGHNSHLHPQVFIGHHCEVGNFCEIKPQAVIGGEGFGYATDVKKMKHHRITHFGRVILEDGVHIGSGTTIDRGTFADSRIGAETKIDNLCHFGHNIEIGKGTIVTGGVVVAGSVKIGSACVIGGGTCIAGHLEITDQVQIGGLSGITKSITESGAYGGYPLQPLKDYLKTQSSLTSLPRLRKTVSQLEKHLDKDR